MQIREPAIGRWLYPELESATLERHEINHSRFNSCLSRVSLVTAGSFLIIMPTA